MACEHEFDQYDWDSGETTEYGHCEKCGAWVNVETGELQERSATEDSTELRSLASFSTKKVKVDRTLRSRKTVADIGQKLAEWSKTWGEYTVIKASRFKAVCQELVEPEEIKNNDNWLWWYGNAFHFDFTVNGECISGYIEQKAYQDGKSVAAIRLSGAYDQEETDRKKQIATKFFEQFFGENIVVEHRRKKIPYPEIGDILKLQQGTLG